VADHDFTARGSGAKLAPYGIYDLAANTGWVNVGIDHDTAVFPRVLAELIGVVTATITKAQHHIQPLLDQHKHTITPADTTLKTLTELTTYAANHDITLTPGTKPAC
jgi:hypothetical protein